MKKLLLIFVLATMFACDSKIKTSEDVAKELTYFKDKRTGLCFAQMQSMSNSGYYINSIACVPCDSVQRLLIP